MQFMSLICFYIYKKWKCFGGKIIMVWELRSSFNFQEGNDVCHPEITENISKFSTQEIQSLKTKINFYINHFSLLAKKDSEPARLRIGFLSKLNALLEKEILDRRSRYFI